VAQKVQKSFARLEPLGKGRKEFVNGNGREAGGADVGESLEQGEMLKYQNSTSRQRGSN